MQLKNHFLIAMPMQQDDYFKQAVIYICDHNEQGSMGLVLTQPTDLSVAELVAKMNFMMADNRQYPDDVVLAGGPVSVENGFILHRKTKLDFQHSYKITDSIQLTTSADIVQTFGTMQQPEKFIVALGCASWAPGQLEAEIADNFWLVVPADEYTLFDVPATERWLAANSLLGIQNGNFVYQQIGHC
ncbi:YqgE/AlgH family protein [Cricetibacter osteomyelitidis]|nr:YqgE/AlgH family protein [Cricetibacter osteomyelitidis]